MHPTAVVASEIELGLDVEIGPFAVIGPGVRLGDGSRVMAHAFVEGPSTFGARTVVHPFAAVGGAPQDVKHKGEPTRLVVGEGNTFREYVSVHRGTVGGGGETRIGDGCLFMAYVHVAHDCTVGSNVIMANASTLAGHVRVGSYVVFGGLAGVAQFVRIGEGAMIAAGAMVENDVPPFVVAAGDRARVRGLNRVGLKRRGVDPESIAALRAAHRHLFRSSAPLAESLRTLDPALTTHREVATLVAFLNAKTA
ncbi:MAG: acyl-ACP--UDP-N-acetylglucosamine O-acyltransferase [Deltaproteobacteria bacterium]|nr:acyl-ACP--UDP-N-acetylglucosamine O-acyltransferase [Deltaproteobacteria bacterium]